jgi:hypothetical protein
MKPWRKCKQQALLPSKQPWLVLLGGTSATVGMTSPEVMVEQANVAMMKLTGILKSKEKKA